RDLIVTGVQTCALPISPAKSRKRRLFWRIFRYRRQISPVSEVLLQFTRGQMTSFSQDFLVLLFQLFPEEFHFLDMQRRQHYSPFAACPDAEFVSPTAGGWATRAFRRLVLQLARASEARSRQLRSG